MRPTARIAGLTSRIAARLRAARKRAGLTQYQLAGDLGLSHRQTVTRIEDGQRSLTAEQLILAMDLLGVDLDYFTDPFRLEGEGEFTFRTGPEVASAAVDEFESRAGRWIAMYRELSRELSREHERKPRWLEPKLALTRHSSLEDASEAGEAFSERMGLGDCPAAALRSALEDGLDILVLEVDAPPGIASAVVRAQGIKCVLVNRHEPEGQRNYGMAHGLFRLLTWDAIPPDRVESVRVPRRGKGWLVARLAESFATALLMPWPVLRRQLGFEQERKGIVSPGEPMRMTVIAADVEGEWRRVRRSRDLPARLIEGADELRVSVETYVRRLRRLYLLSRAQVDALDGQRLVASRPAPGREVAIPAFSAQFVRCVADALDAGRLSVRRAASVLDLSLPELASLLTRYGHEADFEP